MSTVAMGETNRSQKPAVAPRRRYGFAEGQEHRFPVGKSTSDSSFPEPAKTKPARPDPPKFKPEVPPPPNFNKKQVVKKVTVRKPSPPSEPASRELLQSALSQFYGIGSDGYALPPSRARRKKSNSDRSYEVNGTEDPGKRSTHTPTVYLNVAPKTPHGAQRTSQSVHGASRTPQGTQQSLQGTPKVPQGAKAISKKQITPKSSPTGTPVAKRVAERKVSRPPPLRMGGVQVSDSGLNHKFATTSASGRLQSPPKPHLLSAPQKQQLFATNSVPLPNQTAQEVRQNFSKQPLPKNPSDVGHAKKVLIKQGKVVPARPAPPRPYNQKNKSTDIKSGRDYDEEYTYVDPYRYRYAATSLDALDLSNHCKLVDEEMYVNGKCVYDLVCL
jgi:hypothetical protein